MCTIFTQLCLKRGYTPWLFHIAMEHGPLIAEQNDEKKAITW